MECMVNSTAEFSSKYFFAHQNGILTVSPKLEQEIIFDQNLTNVPATEPFVLLDFPREWMVT